MLTAFCSHEPCEDRNVTALVFQDNAPSFVVWYDLDEGRDDGQDPERELRNRLREQARSVARRIAELRAARKHLNRPR